MKTAVEKIGKPRRALNPPPWLATLAALAGAATLSAQVVVDTVTGGPSESSPNTSYGYVDGPTAAAAKFNYPLGLALGSDPSARAVLYVADRDNNAIRKLDLSLGVTITFLPNDVVPASVIAYPVGVAVDGVGSLYVLNRGNGNNGTVLTFDPYGNPLRTNAAALINANGIALDSLANIYVTVEGNKVKRITPAGAVTTAYHRRH